MMLYYIRRSRGVLSEVGWH